MHPEKKFDVLKWAVENDLLWNNSTFGNAFRG